MSNRLVKNAVVSELETRTNEKQLPKAVLELKHAEYALAVAEQAKLVGYGTSNAVDGAGVRVFLATEAVALAEAAAYARDHVAECEPMLTSGALKWLQAHAPIGVLTSVINTHYYAEGLVAEVVKQRELNKENTVEAMKRAARIKKKEKAID